MRLPHRFRAFLLLGLMLPCACAAQAVDEQACKSFAALVVPETDKPTPDEARSAGAPCWPFDLYYNSSAQQRFIKTRWCGLARLGMFRAGSDPKQIQAVEAAISGGATDPIGLEQSDGLVLMMLYANGQGTAKNATVAQMLACQFAFSSPQADENLMPTLLKSLREGQSFDLCSEDASSGQGRNVWYTCARMLAGKAADKSKLLQTAILHVAAPDQRASFTSLLAAWSELDDARSESFSAHCAGGTGCGVMSAQDSRAMEESWLSKLELIHSGSLPQGLPEAKDLQSLDVALNETYKSEMEDAKLLDGTAREVPGQTSEVSSKDRATERAWIRFRDAWVRYASLRWPSIPADRWKAWLTAEWTHVLQS